MNIKQLATLLMLSTVFWATSAVMAQALPLTDDEQQQKFLQDKIKYKDYIPDSYTLFEVVEGDLNQDGKIDVVLIVKATDPKAWVEHEYQGRLDRNRRGMIILLNQSQKNQQPRYHIYLQNLDCFSSENEDGGVYYAPELWIKINKGLLEVKYAHGRYGYWRYLFRLQDSDMRLIGYDLSNNRGPYIESEISVNLLTGRTVYRNNTNKNWEDDRPQFKEIIGQYSVAPIYLSQIEDFDELYFGVPLYFDES